MLQSSRPATPYLGGNMGKARISMTKYLVMHSLSLVLSIALSIPVFAQSGFREAFDRIPVPKVDAPVIVPQIKMGNEAGLIAFRHTHPGYLALNHFDTRIFRFATDAAGRIENVSLFNRMIDGEILSGQYFSVPGGKDTRIVSLNDGDLTTFVTIEETREGVIVSGQDWNREYVAAGGSLFSVAEGTPENRMKTIWQSIGNIKSSILINGKDHSRGELFSGEIGKYMYSETDVSGPSNAEIFEMMIWQINNEFRISISEVEPLGDLYVAEIQSIVKNGRNALFNIAFIDTVIRMEGRITPLLAIFYLDGI